MIDVINSERFIEALFEDRFYPNLLQECHDFSNNKEFPEGFDLFVAWIAYYENLTNFEDGYETCFDDYEILLNDSELDSLELAKDKCIWFYHHLLQDCCYSKIYAAMLSKALDHCLPF